LSPPRRACLAVELPESGLPLAPPVVSAHNALRAAPALLADSVPALSIEVPLWSVGHASLVGLPAAAETRCLARSAAARAICARQPAPASAAA
jgi:hypothetical protein